MCDVRCVFTGQGHRRTVPGMNRDPGKAVHRRIESMREDAAGAVSPVSPRDGDIAAMAGTLGVARRTTCCRF